MATQQTSQEPISGMRVPGRRRAQLPMRKDLYQIGRAVKAWANKNADTLVVGQLSPEELAARRAHQKVDRNPLT